jgi:hypothetical protein
MARPLKLSGEPTEPAGDAQPQQANPNEQKSSSTPIDLVMMVALAVRILAVVLRDVASHPAEIVGGSAFERSLPSGAVLAQETVDRFGGLRLVVREERADPAQRSV